MKSDLHIHTIYSDGELDEYEIIKEVEKAQLDEFAICDHDTLEGSRRVKEILKTQKISAIFHTGVELSSRYKNVNIHLLVRDFDLDDSNMKYLVDKMKLLRKKRISKMLELIKNVYEIDIDINKIQEVEKTTDSFGKPHLYKILLSYGNFDRMEYYKNMDELNCDDYKLDALEIFERLNDSSGYVTLAHPIEIMREYKLTYADIDDLVKELTNIGLKGLESKHSSQTHKDYLQFSKIAQKYNLIETCGSDFHGESVKPGLKIGTFEKR